MCGAANLRTLFPEGGTRRDLPLGTWAANRPRVDTAMTRADLALYDHGSVVLIHPSRRGDAWLDEHVQRGDFNPFPRGRVCEPRFVRDIVGGACAAGLRVEVRS